MKKSLLKGDLLLMALGMAFVSCNDDNGPEVPNGSEVPSETSLGRYAFSLRD